jgi:hypothetical protein
MGKQAKIMKLGLRKKEQLSAASCTNRNAADFGAHNQTLARPLSSSLQLGATHSGNHGAFVSRGVADVSPGAGVAVR